MPPVSARQHLTEKVNLKLDTETLRALERLAEDGDRTVAAEMRRALRAHVEAENGGATAVLEES
jgi:predicted transcriptional regulator